MPSRTDDSPSRLSLRFILQLLSLVALAALVLVSISFLTSSGSKETAPVATLRVSLGSLGPGQMMLVQWEGRPVLVIHRTPEMLTDLLGSDSQLRDPASEKSRQPAFARNPYRSLLPQYFIAIARGTDLGCPVTLAGNVLQDSCRGSKYDLSGRVFHGQQAERNLVVPPYRFESPDLLLLGEEP